MRHALDVSNEHHLSKMGLKLLKMMVRDLLRGPTLTVREMAETANVSPHPLLTLAPQREPIRIEGKPAPERNKAV